VCDFLEDSENAQNRGHPVESIRQDHPFKVYTSGRQVSSKTLGTKDQRSHQGVCEEAGIWDLVNYIDYSGGKAREHSEPKYKLITNHTTRKTFITNSIMLGMNTKTIEEITGHKKDSLFHKYVKISEEFKNLEISRTWDSIPMMGKNPANPKRTKRMNEIEKLLKNSCLLIIYTKMFIKFVSAKGVTM